MADLIFASYLLFVLPGMHLWESLRDKDKPKPAAPQRATARYWQKLRYIVTPFPDLAGLLAWSGRCPPPPGVRPQCRIRGRPGSPHSSGCAGR